MSNSSKYLVAGLAVVVSFMAGRSIGMDSRGPAFRLGWLSGYCERTHLELSSESSLDAVDAAYATAALNLPLALPDESLPRWKSAQTDWPAAPEVANGSPSFGLEWAEYGRDVCARAPIYREWQRFLDYSRW